MHPAEDNTHSTGLYDFIETYAAKDIGEIFRISLLEFMNLPTEYCTKLIEIANKRATTKNNAIDEIANKFDLNKKK